MTYKASLQKARIEWQFGNREENVVESGITQSNFEILLWNHFFTLNCDPLQGWEISEYYKAIDIFQNNKIPISLYKGNLN